MQVEELKSRLAAADKKTSAAPDASKAVAGSTPALENVPKKTETTGSQMRNSIPPTGVVVCF